MDVKETHSYLNNIVTYKETFQKPCNIYKYLRVRSRERPFYLDRNLSYINKHRQQIVVARSKKIDDWAEKRRHMKTQSRRGNRSDNLDNGTIPRINGILEEPRNDNKHCHFEWICNESVRQLTFSNRLLCPWCDKDYHFLDSLMMHLRCCHPRFHFSLHQGTDETIISVSLDYSYDRAYHGFKYPGHDLKQDFRFSAKQKRKPGTRMFWFRPRKHRYNDNAITTVNTNSNSRYNNNSGLDADCGGRLYYHTITCLPIKSQEMDLDSEADTDPAWLRQRTQLMIDEFTDVNEGEKEIFKMWNLHLMANYQHTADHMMKKICVEFIEKDGIQIITRNLSKNFVLHLVNLFNFGLLGNTDVLDLSRRLRKIKPPQPIQQVNSTSNRNILNAKQLTNGLPPVHS